jgi:TonB family protein
MTRAFQLFTMAAMLLQMVGFTSSSVLAQTPPGSQGTDQQQPERSGPGTGVVLPQPLREMKPQYTVEAMRAKIQGSVLLECVVEKDGTVGSVLVVRSLDTRFGLDESAIAAAKQWLFRPGTKDGVPVSVLVTIELTFTLGTSSDLAPLALPESFTAAASGDPTLDPSWDQKEAQASPLTVHFSHPKGWLVTLNPAGVPLSMQHPNGSFLAAMMPPMPTTMDVLEPSARTDLEETAQVVATGYRRPVVAVGQARVAGRLWVWFDLGVADTPASTLQSLPPAVVASRGSNHLWLFSTPIEGQQVLMAFNIFVPRGTQQSEWEAQRLSAGPTFLQILERLSFERMQ